MSSDTEAAWREEAAAAEAGGVSSEAEAETNEPTPKPWTRERSVAAWDAMCKQHAEDAALAALERAEDAEEAELEARAAAAAAERGGASCGTIRIESKKRGSHVHAVVRVGERPGALALAGVLVLRLGEWQALLAALMIGQRAMAGHVLLELPGQDEVCAAFAEDRDDA